MPGLERLSSVKATAACFKAGLETNIGRGVGDAERRLYRNGKLDVDRTERLEYALPQPDLQGVLGGTTPA